MKCEFNTYVTSTRCSVLLVSVTVCNDIGSTFVKREEGSLFFQIELPWSFNCIIEEIETWAMVVKQKIDLLERFAKPHTTRFSRLKSKPFPQLQGGKISILDVPSLPLLGKWIAFLPQAAFGLYPFSNKAANLALQLDHTYSLNGITHFSSRVFPLCSVTSEDIFSYLCTICRDGINMPM